MKMTDLHENETACRTHFVIVIVIARNCTFRIKGFALRLVLKQRHKGTRKWPILLLVSSCHCFKARGIISVVCSIVLCKLIKLFT